MTIAASKKPDMVSARLAQGYEADPPHCGNCDHYVPAVRVPRGRQRGQRCGLGGFPVSGHGICDRWRENGQGLDATLPPGTCVGPAGTRCLLKDG